MYFKKNDNGILTFVAPFCGLRGYYFVMFYFIFLVNTLD